MKSALTINLEYAALRGACAVLNAVPYGIAVRLADGLGWFASSVLRFQRTRTLRRLRETFPELDAAAHRRIAVRSLQGVLRTAVEMIRAPKLNRAWMDRYVVDGEHYKKVLQSLVDEGRGVVVMVPHTGNWYMAAWAMAAYGIGLFALAARQRNPKIDAWMKRQYGSIEVLDRDSRGTLLQIKDKLKAGRAFAILPDLRVRRKDTEVDFLGGKANVSHAGAAFAVKCGAPIVVAAMRRENGKHVIEHLATLRPEGRTAADLTREALALLSDFIRRHPGDWYWYNKRWILEPPTE